MDEENKLYLQVLRVLGSCLQKIDIAGQQCINDQHLTMFIVSVRSNMREGKKGAYSKEQPMGSGAWQYLLTGYQS